MITSVVPLSEYHQRTQLTVSSQIESYGRNRHHSADLYSWRHCMRIHARRSTQHRTLPRPQIISTYLCPHAPCSRWMLGNAVFVFRLVAPREYNTHLGVVKWNLWVMILQHWMRECKAIPRSRRYLAWWSQCHTQQLHWYRLEQLAGAWPA